ncbi:MAG: hypothetical protein J1E38_08640 [Paramuribaculum sp.]|nr:hypothetical protein [Paramuribaculum sp.]
MKMKLQQNCLTLKDNIAKFLQSFSEVVRKAIKAVISFAKSKLYTEIGTKPKPWFQQVKRPILEPFASLLYH